MGFASGKIKELIWGRNQAPANVAQLPGPEVDLPRVLQSVVRFAETKQIIDQVLHAQTERKLRSLAVLSELAQEGRTLFTAVVALGYGQLMRKKVLVVDCSTMRNPDSLTLDRLLDFDDSSEEGKRGEVRRTLSANVSLVRLSEWAEERDAMAEYEVKTLLESVGRSFDLVLFDTCAMGVKNRNNLDPIAIARRCDASMLVVSARTSSRGGLVDIRNRLRKERLELLGLASNDGVTS
jgi:Mrp family chromosome partitioning ATPase